MTKKLPLSAQSALELLSAEIELKGPYRSNWPHYGMLKKNAYHCHIQPGRPTYVACWIVNDKAKKLVEVYYAGTHEGAPY